MSLVSVGGAVLRVVGLNPQRIGSRSESRVASRPTFAGMDHQLTGMGERRVRLAFSTVPHVAGGMDTLAILRAMHQGQMVVPYLRLGKYLTASLLGLVVVQSLDIDESRLHPMTGVGRVVSGEAELILLNEASVVSAGIALGSSLAGLAASAFA